MTNQDLEQVRGRDYYYQLVFAEDGTPINITNWIIYFTAKKKSTDSDANAAIRVDVSTHTDPTHGITVIHVTNTDNLIDVGKYLFDITAKTDTGDVLPPLMSGILSINQDITQRAI